LAYVREFFGCSALDGMELEDADPEMPGSHWEKRLAGNEYMSPVGGPQLFVSDLTLSFLEDMGWYRVNYNIAEGNRWGFHEGCDFVDQACGSANWGRYFCTVPDSDDSHPRCNGDHSALGYCDLGNYNQPLPYGYRYFPADPTAGGSDYFNNYCPIYQGYGNTYCQDVVSGSEYLSGFDPPQYGMVFSQTSACFDFVWQSNGGSDAACYQLSCTTSNNVPTLYVTVYGTTHMCPQQGGDVAVLIPNDNGDIAGANLYCPPADFFCREDTSLVDLPPTSPSVLYSGGVRSYSAFFSGLNFLLVLHLMSAFFLWFQ